MIPQTPYRAVPAVGQDAYVREYNSPTGQYIRFLVNYPRSDLLITWGPLGKRNASRLFDLLVTTRCHIIENYEGPFELKEMPPVQ